MQAIHFKLWLLYVAAKMLSSARSYRVSASLKCSLATADDWQLQGSCCYMLGVQVNCTPSIAVDLQCDAVLQVVAAVWLSTCLSCNCLLLVINSSCGAAGADNCARCTGPFALSRLRCLTPCCCVTFLCCAVLTAQPVAALDLLCCCASTNTLPCLLLLYV